MWAIDMVTSRTFCVERGGEGEAGALYGIYPIADVLTSLESPKLACKVGVQVFFPFKFLCR